MNRLLPLCLLIVILWISAGCSSEEETNPTMAHAEQLMDNHPDSALAIMQKINPQQLHGKRQHALYALLLSQALDKNCINIDNDSLTSIAVDYFQQTDDTHYKAWALYYHGRVYYNAKKYADALMYFKDCEDLAIAEDDHFLLGLIYKWTAEIYLMIHNATEQVEYRLKSMEEFRKTNKQEHLIYSYINLAHAYIFQQNNENAIDTIISLLNNKSIEKDSTALGYAYNRLGYAYYCSHKPDKQIECFLKMIAVAPDIVTPLDYQNLVCAYVKLDKISRAKELSDSLQAVLGEEYTAPENLFRALGDYKKAYYCVREDLWATDKVSWETEVQDVTQRLAAYHMEKQQQLRKEARDQRRLTILISTFFGCIVLTTSIIGILIYRHRQTSIKLALMEAQELKQALSQTEQKIAHRQHLIDNIFADQITTIDKLCRTYYDISSNESKTIIAKKIVNEINSVRSNNKLISDLEQYVNNHFNNLMHDFQLDFPNLRDDEKKYFLFSAVGFSSKAISLLLKVTTNLLYTWKKRLKTKIMESDCQRKNEYLNILETPQRTNAI